MKGRVFFVALVAALSLLSATALAAGHRVVHGTKGDDELTMGAGGQRVFARSGDDSVDGGAGNDRLRGGQDNYLLDGGDGDDYMNGGGDGGDRDRIVCGGGHDVVVLGRNDVVLVEVQASEDAGTDEPTLDEPESGDDDGCEEVKGPGAPKTCASHNRGCDGPADEPCAANLAECDDPVTTEPEPDEPVEVPARVLPD